MQQRLRKLLLSQAPPLYPALFHLMACPFLFGLTTCMCSGALVFHKPVEVSVSCSGEGGKKGTEGLSGLWYLCLYEIKD